MLITSEDNSFIKKIKKLKDKKGRYEEKLFFVEGLNSVKEALDSDFKVEYVVVGEDVEFEFKGDFKLIRIANKLFKKISDTVTPQKIMAIVRMPVYREEDFIKEEGVYVIADNVQDPGNLGTIIRTADAFGADAVFTINNSVDIYNPKVLRASMGSIFHIPVIATANEVLYKLKGKGVKVFATHLKGEKFVHEVEIDKGVAFILGNEARGVSSLDFVDGFIKIPMTGRAESLNVSIAAAIFLYESQRQRLIKNKQNGIILKKYSQMR
ncbi:MAG: rRNA methylase [Caldanaerobacter subterraneus]|uniref:RNA methyltransferase n=2 Tax=Caldanaerobacter subterraneus TaxID=911092 RepID=U5CTD7_CALSX|nr:RNA methyltransferase [Caldanaerobacter subterraneus]ERM92221.1 RNA methyltransferase [Caldanaerobacter subterraneus subsp. yonseiensis KB-1]KUK09328.1 MAG: rRNA methylase [Caldanaerobacter subterraneus]HBT50001.1 RNA methyltransferase [Caldanaerobacter subterraneus]